LVNAFLFLDRVLAFPIRADANDAARRYLHDHSARGNLLGRAQGAGYIRLRK
jgi:hypothetical protein